MVQASLRDAQPFPPPFRGLKSTATFIDRSAVTEPSIIPIILQATWDKSAELELIDEGIADVPLDLEADLIGLTVITGTVWRADERTEERSRAAFARATRTPDAHRSAQRHGA